VTEPFVGLDDLADTTGEDFTDPESAASKAAVIALDAACEIVRGYIDNQVNLTEETILLDGNGRTRLVLPRPPVRDVPDIVLDDVALVLEADYTLEASGIIRLLTGVWTRGLGNVEVTYEHGWDTVEPDDPEYTPEDFERVPSDMRAVALALAKRRFEAASSVSTAGAVIEERIGQGDYQYRTSEGALATSTSQVLLDDEMAVLDRYRNPVNL